MLSKKIKAINNIGIKARACIIFVQAVNQFSSNIEIEFNGATLNAKSLMSVKSLGINQYDEFTLTASGPDEAIAIKTISTLVESGFSFREQQKIWHYSFNNLKENLQLKKTQ